jgi:hypothetical protein
MTIKHDAEQLGISQRRGDQLSIAGNQPIGPV